MTDIFSTEGLSGEDEAKLRDLVHSPEYQALLKFINIRIISLNEDLISRKETVYAEKIDELNNLKQGLANYLHDELSS